MLHFQLLPQLQTANLADRQVLLRSVDESPRTVFVVAIQTPGVLHSSGASIPLCRRKSERSASRQNGSCVTSCEKGLLQWLQNWCAQVERTSFMTCCCCACFCLRSDSSVQRASFSLRRRQEKRTRVSHFQKENNATMLFFAAAKTFFNKLILGEQGVIKHS